MSDTPQLDSLYAPFPDDSDRPDMEFVSADELPEPYRSLLVHNHHMTITVERQYGEQVDVLVLDARQEGDVYARKILLGLQSSGRVVQFGLVRLRLSCCGPEVRQEILSQRTPLGRILIEHDILRHIEPTAFLRVTPGEEMTRWFGLATPSVTYGRLGVIHTDGRPAIEVLEILAPVPDPTD